MAEAKDKAAGGKTTEDKPASASTGTADAKPSEAPKVQAGSQDVSVAVGRLIEESYDYLGQSRHVAAGALHGLPADKVITVTEAKRRVVDFLARPVA